MKKVLSLVCVLLLCAALIPAAVAEEAAYTENRGFDPQRRP